MLAELKLPSGRIMLVEGEASTSPQDVGLNSALSLQELRETLAEFADTLIEPLRSMAADEIELEFTLGVEVSTGRLVAFLIGGKAQSGMKVRVSWKRGQ
jgi:hypothetical protein